MKLESAAIAKAAADAAFDKSLAQTLSVMKKIEALRNNLGNLFTDD